MAQHATMIPLIRGQWIPMSSAEFDEWVPDGMQAEWVDGKGMIFVATSTLHGDLVLFFIDLLRVYVRVFRLGQVYAGPVELRLPPHGQRREPDVFVVLTAELDQIKPMWVEGPVGFVAEFISDHSVREDRVEKLRAYAAAGVPEYLLVDARDVAAVDGVEFYQLNTAGGYDLVAPDELGRYHSRVLPGFWFDPRWFRESPLPAIESLMFDLAPDAYQRWLAEAFQASRRQPRSPS